VYVAGQAAYQLLVAPKGAPDSTVDHIEVDLGATGPLYGVPLQVAVFASGQASPALELGFTGQITLGTPPQSELTFTPPPGVKVVTEHLGGKHTAVSAAGSATGQGAPTPSTSTSPASHDIKTVGTGWDTALTGTDVQLATQAGQGDLAAVSTVVQVAGQPARLLSTDLFNVLVMSDGQFYAGFVTAQALQALAVAAS
jgi:hypothetical protein